MTRRAFLKVVGAGLLITVLPLEALGQAPAGPAAAEAAGVSIAARVHIGKDGAITVMTGKVEGGQGARTELTQAAAEELRLPPDRVQLDHGRHRPRPRRRHHRRQRNHAAHRARRPPGRRRGARPARRAGRPAVGRGPRRWSKSATARPSTPPRKRELTYADLAADDEQAKALQQPAPADVVLTPVKEWKVLGTSVPRPNARDLVTGAHRYPSDMARPGMLYGKSSARPPTARS